MDHYSNMILPHLPRAVTIFATEQLANVDYNIANRVTEDVSVIVQWAYAHDTPWLATAAIETLCTFDNAGSMLIALVVWMAHHTL